MNIEKWKKAAVHLECAGDSVDTRVLTAEQLQKESDLQDGKITALEMDQFKAEFNQRIISGTRDVRSRGTAIFLVDDGKHYLITAKHVVNDKVLSAREAHYGGRTAEAIHNIIFRIKSLDEHMVSPDLFVPFLMNFNAGSADSLPFTFSGDEWDLAIISLSSHSTGPLFVENLLQQGYVPITVSDIADGPNGEGQEVFTVGYPGATSDIGEVLLHPAMIPWASAAYTSPTFSFGRVSMQSQYLPFFWADLNAYPGNSGGAVVAGDKLIGVVSGQASIRVENTQDLYVRIPFGAISKAQEIRGLLAVQKAKDLRSA